MMMLDFQGFHGKDTLEKKIYLNSEEEGFLWSAGIEIDREQHDGFELKCVSLKRQRPKVFRVDMERKGISVVYRVKSEVSERIKIINGTSYTLKINQEGFE